MNRIVSIDIFRALTMFLMIFVNDLWTIREVPHWLEHTEALEDGMGLSDVVFPAFLYIVGLSIPFAIESRLRKKEKKTSVLLHIIMRSLALIIMGFFFVNHQYFHPDVSFAMRNFLKLITIAGFFLLWNYYEKPKAFKFIPVWIFQASGAFLLIYSAYLYKGGTYENPQWMVPHWWGILGMIGWSYLLTSLLYLFFGNRLWVMVPILMLFFALNVQEFRPAFGIYHKKILISASNYALVMSGLVTTLIFNRVKTTRLEKFFPLIVMVPALIAAAFAVQTRPLWGISKILATPSWTAMTAAISFAVFGLIYIFSDILKHTWWARPIMPAGTSALTAYMIPLVAYSGLYPYLAKIPVSYTTGSAGLVKSVLFAGSVVLVTWALEKIKIRVKL